MAHVFVSDIRTGYPVERRRREAELRAHSLIQELCHKAAELDCSFGWQSVVLKIEYLGSKYSFPN